MRLRTRSTCRSACRRSPRTDTEAHICASDCFDSAQGVDRRTGIAERGGGKMSLYMERKRRVEQDGVSDRVNILVTSRGRSTAARIQASGGTEVERQG
eukprot:3663648-Pleurochrysis_carterae.AAC.2